MDSIKDIKNIWINEKNPKEFYIERNDGVVINFPLSTESGDMYIKLTDCDQTMKISDFICKYKSDKRDQKINDILNG